jgi:hypothetical protein
VRQWYGRTVTADTIIEMLGESSKRKSKRPPRPVRVLLKLAHDMAAANIYGDVERAVRLAHEFIDVESDTDTEKAA